MTAQSKRLQRVLRKYAIERRLALFGHAKASREQAALDATLAQLTSARDRHSPTPGKQAGAELSQASEWRSRLNGAIGLLTPSLELSSTAAAEAAQSVHRASGRVDRLERKIDEASRSEERQRAILLGSIIKRGRTAKGRAR